MEGKVTRLRWSSHVWEEEEAKEGEGLVSLTLRQTGGCLLTPADLQTKDGSLAELYLHRSGHALAEFTADQSICSKSAVSAAKQNKPHSLQTHPAHPGFEVLGPVNPTRQE